MYRPSQYKKRRRAALSALPTRFFDWKNEISGIVGSSETPSQRVESKAAFLEGQMASQSCQIQFSKVTGAPRRHHDEISEYMLRFTHTLFDIFDSYDYNSQFPLKGNIHFLKLVIFAPERQKIAKTSIWDAPALLGASRNRGQDHPKQSRERPQNLLFKEIKYLISETSNLFWILNLHPREAQKKMLTLNLHLLEAQKSLVCLCVVKKKTKKTKKLSGTAGRFWGSGRLSAFHP